MAFLKKATPCLYHLLPQGAGVYVFMDKARKPIYIGKAINLKNRIKQHFTNKNHSKELLITKNTVYIRLHETDSEFAALVLEANFIRQYLPKYNAILTDDKSRLYLVVSKENYPKVSLVRKRDVDSSKYQFIFGPVGGMAAFKPLLRKIRQVIPFCMEKKISRKPCFYNQIGLCEPCPNSLINLPTPQQNRLKQKYCQNIRRLIRLLKGNGKGLLKDYNKELQKLSDRQRFEEAAKLRDRIFYLEQLFQKKLIFDNNLFDPDYIKELRKEQSLDLQQALGLDKLRKVECYDVSNLNFKEATASMVVFINGESLPDQYRRFKIKGKTVFDPEMLAEVLRRRLMHEEWSIPDLIVIDGGSVQLLQVVPEIRKKTTLPKVIGFAKHPDRIILPEAPFGINLPQQSLAIHYLERLRDEAHRFAKKYHVYLRRKSLENSLRQVK